MRARKNRRRIGVGAFAPDKEVAGFIGDQAKTAFTGPAGQGGARLTVLRRQRLAVNAAVAGRAEPGDRHVVIPQALLIDEGAGACHGRKPVCWRTFGLLLLEANLAAGPIGQFSNQMLG